MLLNKQGVPTNKCNCSGLGFQTKKYTTTDLKQTSKKQKYYQRKLLATGETQMSQQYQQNATNTTNKPLAEAKAIPTK